MAKKKTAVKKRTGKQTFKKPVSRKKAPPEAASRMRAASPTPTVFYRLNAFLHTLRVIAGYEDQLCTLLHASRPGTAPDATTHRELLSLLEEMPAVHYSQELEALREALLPRPVAKKRAKAAG